MYYSGAFIPYVILVVASLVLGLGTQWYIKHEFKKYSLVPSGFNATGASVARAMMDTNGAANVGIKRISGELTDNYDPRDNCLHLSDANFSEGSAMQFRQPKCICHLAFVPLLFLLLIWHLQRGFMSFLLVSCSMFQA